MDKELTELDLERDQEEIIRSFPVLFRHIKWIPVGIGWYGIIYDLCVKIEAIIKEEYKDVPTDDLPVFQDFKEKFGSLRVSVYNASERVLDAVEEAESLSESTCEPCGRKSKIEKTRGWLFNRCERCKDG